LARLVIFGDPDDPRKWVPFANEIAARIADGRYPTGKWLPPITKINADLGNGKMESNHSKIQRALDEICTQGLATFVNHTGYYTGDEEPAEKPEARPVRYTNKRSARPREPQDGKPSPREQFLADEEYITTAEFATMLRVSRMTAYRKIHGSELPGVIQVGRSFRIPVSAARAYLKTSALDGQQPDLPELTDDEETAGTT
jgi:excisionase family DNA binding protein